MRRGGLAASVVMSNKCPTALAAPQAGKPAYSTPRRGCHPSSPDRVMPPIRPGSRVQRGGEAFRGVSLVSADIPRRVPTPVADCPQCAREAAGKTKADRGLRDDVIPWAIAFTVAVVAACVGAGADRWFGIGVIAGLLAGGACAWFSARESLREKTVAHEHSMSALEVDADQRVASVVRQFEWAVNDIARLKRDADRAGLTAEILLRRSREREQYVRKIEADLADAQERLAISVAPVRRVERSEFDMDIDAVPAVPFLWALHHDGYGVNLEMQCANAQNATRVRIVDGDGSVVMTSGTPMYSDEGIPAFTMWRPPVEFIVDLDTAALTGYRIEALVDLEWTPVRLQDTGRRTKSAWDKRGQMYRVSATDVYGDKAARAS
jgi:hypothetical protein